MKSNPPDSNKPVGQVLLYGFCSARKNYLTPSLLLGKGGTCNLECEINWKEGVEGRINLIKVKPKSSGLMNRRVGQLEGSRVKVLINR